eukprot:2422423-Prorocentrum_lima.AAC.1
MKRERERERHTPTEREREREGDRKTHIAKAPSKQISNLRVGGHTHRLTQRQPIKAITSQPSNMRT